MGVFGNVSLNRTLCGEHNIFYCTIFYIFVYLLSMNVVGGWLCGYGVYLSGHRLRLFTKRRRLRLSSMRYLWRTAVKVVQNGGDGDRRKRKLTTQPATHVTHLMFLIRTSRQKNYCQYRYMSV